MTKAKKQTRSTGARAKKSSKSSIASSVTAPISTEAALSTAQKTVRKAKQVVSENANGKTAFMALMGAGALALVSTEAGRGMLKSAASYLTSLAESARGVTEKQSEAEMA